MMLFALIWGYWALQNTPLDAIPDLSDTQVIIYADGALHPGQDPAEGE